MERTNQIIHWIFKFDKYSRALNRSKFIEFYIILKLLHSFFVLNFNLCSLFTFKLLLSTPLFFQVDIQVSVIL